MNTNPEISIALCTYNGERYLLQQLKSFLEQTLLPFELVACDDASSDSTCKILEEFSHKAPFPVRIVQNEHNLGLRKNFSQAAGLCSGQYIAFSDQDDIWLPDKLEQCYLLMRKAEEEYGTGIPLLVHSDLSLIDTENRMTEPSCMKVLHMRPEPIDPLKTLLVRNTVFGCTSLCNRKLMKESIPFPDVITNHDGWCALIAASHGKIIFHPKALVLYRQHESAVTDAATSPYHIRLLFRRLLNPKRGVTAMLGFLHQTEELEKRLNEISCPVPSYLRIYIRALKEGGLLNAIRVVLLIRVRHQGVIPNIFFFYRISRGSHIKYIKYQ
jgi:glycosyltransferase involved in cell wall biosynthesis